MDRIFLIVLDSAGIGGAPDAAEYGDAGSDTFRTLYNTGLLKVPNMARLGLYNIDSMDYAAPFPEPEGAFARVMERSKGKDTTIGHWEIAGIVSQKPLPVYPGGFPDDLLSEYSRRTGRAILCNKPYSGTSVIKDYGKLQKESGGLIVYTSADSVFQVAAHEEWLGLDELYRCCEIAREMLKGEHGVGRVIARPFTGEYPDYKRTSNRHDYSLEPPAKTMCDYLCEAGFSTIGVGKIYDIFAGRGIQQSVRTSGNQDGMTKASKLLGEDFRGLAFINLVDFDMLYGHRNDAAGYTAAMNAFDQWLGGFMSNLSDGDMLMITADHGCDPGVLSSTDHSRECVPLLVFGSKVRKGVNLGIRTGFCDISATILDIFGVHGQVDGESFKDMILHQ